MSRTQNLANDARFCDEEMLPVLVTIPRLEKHKGLQLVTGEGVNSPTGILPSLGLLRLLPQLEEVHAPSSPPSPPLTPTSSFVDLLDHWLLLISRDRKRTEKTVARYHRQRAYLQALFEAQLRELDRPRILAWHDDVTIARGACYADTAATVLRVVLEYAWNRGLVLTNNASRMGLDYHADPQPGLSQEQWSAMVRELLEMFSERLARAIRMRRSPAFEFASTSAVASSLALLLSAPRQSEICNSQVPWWHPEIASLKCPVGKTGPQTIVFGSKLGLPFMQRRACEARSLGFLHLFPSPVFQIQDKAITTCALWDTWTIAAGRAGVRGIPPHGARRTAACSAIEEDMPEELVMQFLNHRELRTTRLYTAMARKPGQRRVAEALDNLRERHAPDLVKIVGGSAENRQTVWRSGGAS